MTQRVNLCFRICSRESSSYYVEIGVHEMQRKFTPRIKDKGESKPPVALGWNFQTQPLVNLQVAEASHDTRNCYLSCNEGVNYRAWNADESFENARKNIWCTLCTFNSSLIYIWIYKIKHILLFSGIFKKKRVV